MTIFFLRVKYAIDCPKKLRPTTLVNFSSFLEIKFIKTKLVSNFLGGTLRHIWLKKKSLSVNKQANSWWPMKWKLVSIWDRWSYWKNNWIFNYRKKIGNINLWWSLWGILTWTNLLFLSSGCTFICPTWFSMYLEKNQKIAGRVQY